MARKISFDVDVNPGGFDAGMRMIEAKAAAANGRMNATVYQARQAGLNKAQIQARADYEAKEEHRAKRKAEVEAARNAPMQGPDIFGVMRAKAAAAEVARYQENLTKTTPGSFLNPRGSMSADQAAWNARLAAAKQQVQLHRKQVADLVRMPDQTFVTGGAGPGGMGGGGRRGSFGAASSMFISAARDSAASLASGAPITQIIAQQAPQVLQALSMMNLGMVAVGVAAAAVGTAIAAKILVGLKDSYLMTNQIADGMTRIAAMTDRLRIAASMRALESSLGLKSLESEAKSAEIFAKTRLEESNAAADLEKEQVKAAHRAQHKIATKRTELELERKLLEVDLKRAEVALQIAEANLPGKSAVTAAAAALADFNIKADKQYAEDEARIKEADARTKKTLGTFSTQIYTPEERQARNAAIAQATQAAEENKAKLWEERRRLEKELENAKKQTGQADIDAARARLMQVKNSIADLENKPRDYTKVFGSDALVRVGNFIGSNRGKIESLAQKQTDLLVRIEMNTRKTYGEAAIYSY